jgi:hypothetical protein
LKFITLPLKKVPLEVFLRQEEWREDFIVIELCPSSWRNDVLWDFSQGYVLTEEEYIVVIRVT